MNMRESVFLCEILGVFIGFFDSYYSCDKNR